LSWSTSTALKLGRVSNLPTVWTNTLAGAVLAGGFVVNGHLAILLIAMTLAYTGGMFLNDAFDRKIDARERPERPIPSGDVTASSVFISGFGMLAGSIVLVAWSALSSDGGGWPAIVAALLLSGAIVLYNVWHKANPLSPLIMGLCRMLVYITAGYALTPEPSNNLYLGALILLCYLIGLTYTAKQENLGEVKNLWPLLFLASPILGVIFMQSAHAGTWLVMALFVAWLLFALNFLRRRRPGDIPRAVVSMIAGISLIDALFIAAAMRCDAMRCESSVGLIQPELSFYLVNGSMPRFSIKRLITLKTGAPGLNSGS